MNVIRHELTSNPLLMRIMHLKYNFLHVDSHFCTPGTQSQMELRTHISQSLPHLENGSLVPETERILLEELFQIKNTVS